MEAEARFAALEERVSLLSSLEERVTSLEASRQANRLGKGKSQSSITSSRIEKRLARAHGLAARSQGEIRCVLTTIGVLLICTMMIVAIIYYVMGPDASNRPSLAAALVPFAPAFFLLLLAMPSQRVRLVARIWLSVNAIVCVALSYNLYNRIKGMNSCLADGYSSHLACRAFVPYTVSLVVMSVVAAGLVVPSTRRSTPERVAIHKIWWSARWTCLVVGIILAVFNPLVWEMLPRNEGVLYLVSAASAILCGLWASETRRGRAMKRIANLFAGPEARAASAIASMIGGGSKKQDEQLDYAREHFCALPFDVLTSEDLATNDDTGLPSRTVKTPLGRCDAFMSHSWHDPHTDKWRALCSWAEAFKATNGHSPTLWLDKACLDQRQIEQQVALLPVYVCGCKEFLALIGPTYTSRLWCVTECFAFLAIKGIDSANARPLTRCCYAGGGGTTLEGFRVLKAQCSNVHQRQLLMGIIERSYPDLSEFNEAIKRLLDADDDDDELRPLAERTIALTEDGETVTGDARV